MIHVHASIRRITRHPEMKMLFLYSGKFRGHNEARAKLEVLEGDNEIAEAELIARRSWDWLKLITAWTRSPF
jgi:hypothetical protein